jgi:hypothetical protein
MMVDTAAGTMQLARKTLIGHRNLEMSDRRTRLDDGQGHQTGDQEADGCDRDHRAEAQGGYAEAVSGAEQGHGAGKLPGCREGGNRCAHDMRIA